MNRASLHDKNSSKFTKLHDQSNKRLLVVQAFNKPPRNPNKNRHNPKREPSTIHQKFPALDRSQ
jgi:hypothetical protein